MAKARKKKVKPRPNGANYNSFKYLLHDSEKQRLQNYNQMWKERHGVPACKDPRAIVHLGDNPLARPCWSINGLPFPSEKHGALVALSIRNNCMPQRTTVLDGLAIV